MLKPVMKGYILYGSIFVECPEQINHATETENRLFVAWYQRQVEGFPADEHERSEVMEMS